MKFIKLIVLIVLFGAVLPVTPANAAVNVSFNGRNVLVNGKPINQGSQAEGLLISSRMVFAGMADYSSNADKWRYPNEAYTPQRNLNEFLAELPTYASYGLNMVTVSMMGGHPRWKCGDDGGSGRSNFSMFESDGTLREDAKVRLRKIIEAAAQNGIIVNVQYFYRTAERRLNGDSAVLRAVDQATTFLKSLGTGNILIEVANEVSDKNYDGALDPTNIHARINQVHDIWPGALTTVSLHAGAVYPTNLRAVVDWASLHTNALSASQVSSYVQKFKTLNIPIAITEDKWSGPDKMNAAIGAGAGYGYYDQGCEETGSYVGTQAYYSHGFQSPPVNWAVNTDRKRKFFNRVEQVTG